MSHFGEDLKKEREGRGVSLETLAEETRVKVAHLQALEEERYPEMPGGVFRRGIAQAYIQALGLDAPTWMSRFTQNYAEYVQQFGHASAENHEDWTTFAENVKRNRTGGQSRSGVRWAGVLVLLGVVLLAAWATWRFVLHGVFPGS